MHAPISATRTIGGRLEANNGIGPGFDQLRVLLSVAILFWHSFGLSYGIEWTKSLPSLPFKPLVPTLLPMFFALSGFLVTGSALRTNNLRTFMAFRTLRIVPALFTEISLSALILGPLLTVVPLSVYFTSSEFIEYFGSLVGRVRYVLPGLFVNNPNPLVVNGALWTVGPEILCYILMALALLFGLLQRRRAVLLLTAAYVVACLATDFWSTFPNQPVLPTKTLILSFLGGSLIFLYREAIPYRPILMVTALVGAVVMIFLAQAGYPPLAYVAAVALSYVVVFLGMTELPALPFFHRGDYSYGIYIFGYPIQQAVAHFFPDHRSWWFNFALALPVTVSFAVASWHLIEKPSLKLRKRFATSSISPKSRTRVIIAGLLIAYGLLVSYWTQIFPVREIAKDFVGLIYTR